MTPAGLIISAFVALFVCWLFSGKSQRQPMAHEYFGTRDIREIRKIDGALLYWERTQQLRESNSPQGGRGSKTKGGLAGGLTHQLSGEVSEDHAS
jgi:hypothetical protein